MNFGENLGKNVRFVGLQIRKVMFDENFKRNLKFFDFAEWKSLMSLVRGFLGNKK